MHAGQSLLIAMLLQAAWGQTLRAVYTFQTVEDFWW